MLSRMVAKQPFSGSANRNWNVAKSQFGVSDPIVEKMIVRQPQDRSKNLHPSAKKRWNRMSQEPRPLKYKLHDLGED